MAAAVAAAAAAAGGVADAGRDAAWCETYALCFVLRPSLQHRAPHTPGLTLHAPAPLLPSRPPDFKNVSIVGHYIKDRTKNAQFVIISLRNNMFELADRLVGIYK